MWLSRRRVRHRLTVAADTGIHRRRRSRPSDEDDATAAGFQKVCGDGVAGPAVVDADQVVLAAVRIGHQIAIEQHQGNAGAVEDAGDASIDRVFLAGELERCEEHARHLLLDELRAGLGRLFLDVRRIRQRAAPEQRVLLPVPGIGHAAADRFEDLGAPQFRNEQAEHVAAAGRVLANVAAGAGPPFDHTGQLQVAQRAIHRRTRRAECFHERRLARQPLPGRVAAGRDVLREALPNALVLR